MVAITVILAAVIGAFVLDLAPGQGSQAPQTQMGVSDASADSSPVSDGSTNDMIIVSHNAGDELPAGEYTVRIKQSSSDTYTEISDSDTLTHNSDGTIETSISPSSTGLSTGDQFAIEISASGSDVSYDGDWDVQVLHDPSDTMVTDTTIEVE